MELKTEFKEHSSQVNLEIAKLKFGTVTPTPSAYDRDKIDMINEYKVEKDYFSNVGDAVWTDELYQALMQEEISEHNFVARMTPTYCHKLRGVQLVRYGSCEAKPCLSGLLLY